MWTDHVRICWFYIYTIFNYVDITTSNYSSNGTDIGTTVMIGFQTLSQKSPEEPAQNNKIFNQDI
jgi:hypothetical protein